MVTRLGLHPLVIRVGRRHHCPIRQQSRLGCRLSFPFLWVLLRDELVDAQWVPSGLVELFPVVEDLLTCVGLVVAAKSFCSEA